MASPVYSEEVVLEVAATVLSHARANLSALSAFGINEGMLQEFENGINEAKALPREISNRAQLKVQTRTKQEVLDNCYDWSTHTKLRIEMAFGRKSVQTNAFPSKEVRRGRKSERVMLGIFEMIIGLAEQYQTELAAYGQTEDFLTQGKDLYQQLRAANEAQELKKKEKVAATKVRREKFKALYDTVNRINKAGQVVFKNEPAKQVLFQRLWPIRQANRRGDDAPETAAAESNSTSNE